LRKDTSDLDVRNKYAMTFVSSDNPMRGILMLREITQYYPENEDAQFNLGVLSMQSGQFQKAVERFDQVLAINDNRHQARLLSAVANISLGNVTEAEKILLDLKERTDDPEILSAVETYMSEIK
jgi:Tfp pilus assembly protein PilF